MRYLVAWNDGDGLELRIVPNLDEAKDMARDEIENSFLVVQEFDEQAIVSIGHGSRGELMVNGKELPMVFHWEDEVAYVNAQGWPV